MFAGFRLEMTWPRAGLIAALAAGLSGCEPAAPPPPPPAAVEYQLVEQRPVATIFEFVARTRAREDAALRAQVSGTIIERSFEEGQELAEGAVMFRIDPRPYQAALESAKAQRSRAESSLALAGQNLARGQQLVGDGYISQSDMDRLLGERDGAKAALEAANAALENARINLAFTEVRAPFTGTAGRSTVSLGDLVGPDSGTLVTLVKQDPMLVDFDVNEQALARSMAINQQRLAEGLPPVTYKVRLRLATGNFYAHPGEIEYADNRVNPGTGTVTVTARFANPDKTLYPGQFARIHVQRGEPELRLLIAQSSVLEDMQGKYVFVVTEGDLVQRRNVRIGQVEGLSFVVEEGLEDGDRVIVNGIQKVRPGMTVIATPVAVPLEASGEE